MRISGRRFIALLARRVSKDIEMCGRFDWRLGVCVGVDGVFVGVGTLDRCVLQCVVHQPRATRRLGAGNRTCRNKDKRFLGWYYVCVCARARAQAYVGVGVVWGRGQGACSDEKNA